MYSSSIDNFSSTYTPLTSSKSRHAQDMLTSITTYTTTDGTSSIDYVEAYAHQIKLNFIEYYNEEYNDSGRGVDNKLYVDGLAVDSSVVIYWVRNNIEELRILLQSP